MQEAWFPASDGASLFGWYVAAPAAAGVLLWCHGNAGNITHRLENLGELYRTGLSAFLFYYRGYGRSRGRPSEPGLYQDALAAHDYLTGRLDIDPRRIVLFGRSLGASVAAEVATRRAAAGLILESCFPSVAAVAEGSPLGFPARWLFRARFDLVQRLRTIRLPVLVVHGDRDTTIPLALGQQVYDAVQGPKSFYLVHGADHNDLYHVGGKPYFQRLKRFVQDVVK